MDLACVHLCKYQSQILESLCLLCKQSQKLLPSIVPPLLHISNLT